MAAPGYTEGEVPALSRVISRPLTDDEKSKVKEVFDKFDKDKSGQISVAELAIMAAELGAQISQEEAAKVMAQIDKNANQQCSFDEFLLWWTSDPKLGGYNSLVLQLMKMKLAAQVKTGQVAARLAQAKPRGALAPNEIALKAEMDISPGMVGCEPKMSVRGMVRAAQEQNEGCFVKLVLTVASEAGGEVVQTAIDGLAPLLAMAPFQVNTTVEGDKVTILMTTPAEMVPGEFQEMGQFAVAALPTLLEGNFSWSKSFEDVVAFENNPLRNLLGAVKVSEHVRIDINKMTELVDNMIPDMGPFGPNRVLKMLLCSFAGMEADIRVGYHEQFFKNVLDFFKPFLGDMGPLAALQQDWGNHSLSQIRDIMLMMMIQMDIDPKKPPPELAAVLTPVRALAKHVKTVDTLTIGGLPNTPLEIYVEFVEFNPFPVAGYMCDTLGNVPAKVNPGGKAAKPLSSAEVDRIKVIFDKFDKDNNGSIDLNEIKAMCQELGSPISDVEAGEAMAELDKSGAGKCNFEDFKSFWTGRGGPSSLALKFLRAKMTAKSTLQSFVSWARAPVNADNALEVKMTSTCTPGMTACDEKMSMNMELKPGAGGFAGAALRLEAKDAAAATAIKTSCDNLWKSAQELIFAPEGNAPPFTPIFETDGAAVILKCGPPEGMPMEMMLPPMQDPQIQAAVKAVNFKYKLALGTTFGDLIQNGDKPIYQTLGGCKAEGSISISADTKKLLAGMLPDYIPPMQLAKAMLTFFAGLEVTALSGYKVDGLDEVFAGLLAVTPKPYDNTVVCTVHGDAFGGGDADEGTKAMNWCKEGVLAVEKESGKVGIVNSDPDCDKEIKLTFVTFDRSSYIKVAAEPSPSTDGEAWTSGVRQATDEEKAAFLNQRKGMVTLSGLREWLDSLIMGTVENDMIRNPQKDVAVFFEMMQVAADILSNTKAVTSIETGDGVNTTLAITFNNFLVHELAAFFLVPLNEKVQSKKSKFEAALKEMEIQADADLAALQAGDL